MCECGGAPYADHAFNFFSFDLDPIVCTEHVVARVELQRHVLLLMRNTFRGNFYGLNFVDRIVLGAPLVES